MQRHAEALEAYRKALAIQPDFPGANLNLGRLLATLKRPDEGLEYLQAALSRLPDSALGHFMLGDVLGSLGFTAEAVSEVQHALQLQPTYHSAIIDDFCMHAPLTFACLPAYPVINSIKNTM